MNLSKQGEGLSRPHQGVINRRRVCVRLIIGSGTLDQDDCDRASQREMRERERKSCLGGPDVNRWIIEHRRARLFCFSPQFNRPKSTTRVAEFEWSAGGCRRRLWGKSRLEKTARSSPGDGVSARERNVLFPSPHSSAPPAAAAAAAAAETHAGRTSERDVVLRRRQARYLLRYLDADAICLPPPAHCLLAVNGQVYSATAPIYLCLSFPLKLYTSKDNTCRNSFGATENN